MSPTRGVIQEAWGMYKAHLVHFAGIAAVIWIPVAILETLIEPDSVLTLSIGSMISLIGLSLTEGVFVKAVQDVRDGRADMGVVKTFKQAAPYFGAIIGASFLASIGITIGLIFLIVPGLILFTWWLLIPPIIVLEESRAIAAFGRSKELVRGYGWEVFGVIVLTYVAMIAAGILLGLALVPLHDQIGNFLANLISGVAIAPFATVTWVLLYFRLSEGKTNTGPAAPPPTI